MIIVYFQVSKGKDFKCSYHKHVSNGFNHIYVTYLGLTIILHTGIKTPGIKIPHKNKTRSRSLCKRTEVCSYLVQKLQLFPIVHKLVCIHKAPCHRPRAQDQVLSNTNQHIPVFTSVGEPTHCHTKNRPRRKSQDQSKCQEPCSHHQTPN